MRFPLRIKEFVKDNELSSEDIPKLLENDLQPSTDKIYQLEHDAWDWFENNNIDREMWQFNIWSNFQAGSISEYIYLSLLNS